MYQVLKAKLRGIFNISNKISEKNLINFKIFDIFKSNKLILLFLNEQKILIMDQFVFNRFSSQKYNQIFLLKFNHYSILSTL